MSSDCLALLVFGAIVFFGVLGVGASWRFSYVRVHIFGVFFFYFFVSDLHWLCSHWFVLFTLLALFRLLSLVGLVGVGLTLFN